MCSQCGAVYHLEHYRAEGKGPVMLAAVNSIAAPMIQKRRPAERLDVYMRQTHPVLHYYARDGRLYSIDGVRPIDVVFADVDHYLQNLSEELAVGEAQ
jgi:adenylate kinase